MNDEHLIKPPPTKQEVAAKAGLLTSFFKQLITLNASGIGLIVVFGNNFASDHLIPNILLALAPLAFLISLYASFAMFLSMTAMQHPNEGDKLLEDKSEEKAFWASIMGFLVGVLCLIWLALINFISVLPIWLLGVAGLVMLVIGGIVLAKRIKAARRMPMSRHTD